MPRNSKKSEAPEVAASEASVTHPTKEQENNIMSQPEPIKPEPIKVTPYSEPNRHPVEGGPLKMGVGPTVDEFIDAVDSAELIHPAGPFPSIRPVICEPWCTDGDGHIREGGREDQNCWGESHYVELTLEEVGVEVKADAPYGHTIWPAIVGPNAYRGFNEHPCVYVHLLLPRWDIDSTFKLTSDEARDLAAHLLAVAEEIEGAK